MMIHWDNNSLIEMHVEDELVHIWNYNNNKTNTSFLSISCAWLYFA